MEDVTRMEVQGLVGKLYQGSFDDNLLALIKEGVSILSRLGNSDPRLGFHFAKELGERVSHWVQELRNGQPSALSQGYIVDLSRLSDQLTEIQNFLYLGNGGAELERGRVMIQDNTSSDGHLDGSKEEELVKGLDLMGEGLSTLAEADLYTAQANVLSLRYFMEAVALESAPPGVVKRWREVATGLMEILNRSMEGFYPARGV